jgi:hypothetical protein
MDKLDKWKSELGLDDWSIRAERISPNQVTYDDSIPDGDRYFIGIEIDRENKIGVIYHDIDLCEESVLHELLHIKYPDKDEDWVNETTKQYLHSKYKY